MSNNLLIRSPRRVTNVIVNHIQKRFMPVNVPPTATGKRRFRLSVETDPHKLVNYCCGLNYRVNDEPVKLKPDNEYPDWLWTLRLGPKPNSWEMEPGTKEYYLKLLEEKYQDNLLLRMYGPKKSMTVGKVLNKQNEYLHHIRFAALAHMEEDVGYPQDSLTHDWYSYKGNRIEARKYYLPPLDKEIYMDKVEGNSKTKNFFRNPESSFNRPMRMTKNPAPVRAAIQDSKRRHMYSSF